MTDYIVTIIGNIITDHTQTPRKPQDKQNRPIVQAVHMKFGKRYIKINTAKICKRYR